MAHRWIALLIALLALGAVAPIAAAEIAYTPLTGGNAQGAPIMVAADDGSGPTRLGVRGSAPAISPDGTRVAYVAGAVGTGTALRIRTIATGAEVEADVAFGWSSSFHALWSADGASLLVPTDASRADGTVLGTGLSVVNAATGAATTVVAPRGNAVTGAAWSPTAPQFVYAQQRWGGRPYAETMRIAGVDGAVVLVVGRGSNPVWGPRRIAFQRFASARWQGMQVWHAQVWLADPAGGAPTQLTRATSTGLVTGPSPSAWAPNGGRLYGAIGGEDVSVPIRIAAGNGRITRLRDGRGRILSGSDVLAVSADGRTVLLRQWEVEGGSGGLRTMPSNGGQVRAFRVPADEISVTRSWQP